MSQTSWRVDNWVMVEGVFTEVVQPFLTVAPRFKALSAEAYRRWNIDRVKAGARSMMGVVWAAREFPLAHLARRHGELSMPVFAKPADMPVDRDIVGRIDKDQTGPLVAKERLEGFLHRRIAADQPVRADVPDVSWSCHRLFGQLGNTVEFRATEIARACSLYQLIDLGYSGGEGTGQDDPVAGAGVSTGRPARP